MTFALGEDTNDESIIVPSLAMYQTRVKADIYSHNYPTPINISSDIVSCVSSKTTKGTGKINITLNASRNYLNLVFPNDMINVYFHHDSQTGWIRTFFGFIDRIEESYSVSANGVPTTTYVLIGSGWEKAIDKTQIYFNPPLANRPDFSGSDFATLNVAGLTLMTNGIKVSGTPADIVINLLMLHMGFGAQWTLPQSVNPRVPNALLQKRQELISGILLQAVENSFTGDTLERVRDVITSGELERAVREPTSTEGPDEGSSSDTPNTTAHQGDIDVAETTRLLHLPSAGAGGEFYSAIALYLQNARARTSNAALLDLVNLTDYIERLAIDGFITDSSIWEQQGSLLNIIRSQSNEFVNELFFDLRPALDITDLDSTDTEQQISSSWSREPDEFEGNLSSEGANAGPRYEAAVVMREYPFSTVRKVNAMGIPSGVADGFLDVYYFGALFSNAPNVPGRHFVHIPTIHPAHRVQGQTTLGDVARKHLDVAVIHEQEITSSRLGRSDNDHYNLFEATLPDTLGGNSVRYMMVNLLPIITPIHIMRHGLRVRSVTSRFSLYNLSTAVAHVQPDNSPPETAEAASAPVEEVEFSTELIPPLAAHPSIKFFNANKGDYGYRVHNGKWVFHNGIDISGTAGEVPVVAIADGMVVASAASGTPGVSGYGECIVVHHPQFQGPGGKKVYSLYAHLDRRDIGSANTARNPIYAFAADERHRRGRFVPIRVSKGQQLGLLGRTAGTTEDYGRIMGGPHLHFEIDYTWPSKNKPQTPDVEFSQVPSGALEAPVVAYVQNVLHKPGTNSNNIDPVVFFQDHGVALVASLHALAGHSETTDAEVSVEDEGTGGGEEAEPVSPSRANTAHTNEAAEIRATGGRQITSNVDNQTSRSQLARWALLNDHWFQHNLEYLSGTIAMRGAPEIRVGMRLDIVERNMSFYVEGLQHSWTYPNEMKTVLQVVRGQTNNPYPAYVVPPAGMVGDTNLRRRGSRLAVYSLVADPVAVRNSLTYSNPSVYVADGVVSSQDSPDNPDNWSADGYEFEEAPYATLFPAETVDYQETAPVEVPLPEDPELGDGGLDDWLGPAVSIVDDHE